MFIDFGAANAHVSFLYSFLETHNSEACERVSENPPEFINFLSFTLLNVFSVRNFIISRSTTGRPYLMMFLLLPHICWLFTLTPVISGCPIFDLSLHRIDIDLGPLSLIPHIKWYRHARSIVRQWLRDCSRRWQAERVHSVSPNCVHCRSWNVLSVQL